MRLFAIVSASLLLASLAGCANKPPAKPKGELCALNANSSYLLCFNLETDFDDNLRLKKDVKGARKPITFEALHKAWVVDTPTKEELESYALKWKARYIELERRCK